MAFYDKFPYTNFQEINLDWIIKALNILEQEQKEFINNNVIKYADPIGWNITTQYEANTVVTDVNGNAYISSQPVPVGVNITNTDYWSKIGNFDVLWSTVKNGITTADEGAGTTATAARAVNDLVWVQDELLRVTAPMIAGDSYVIGSNAVNTSVSLELLRRIAAETILQTAIQTEVTDRTNADDAINNTLTTVQTDIGTINGDISDIQSDIDDLQDAVTRTQQKYYIFIGDSYLARDNNQLTSEIAARLNITSNDYAVQAEGSSGFVHQGLSGNTFNNLLNTAYAIMTEDERDKVTDIVFLGGANDTLHTRAEIETAVTACAANCSSKFPAAQVHVGFIARLVDPAKIRTVYDTCSVYANIPTYTTWQYLNNVQYVLHDYALMDADGVHPNADGYVKLGGYIAQALKTGSCNVHYPQSPIGSYTATNNDAKQIYCELINNSVHIFTNSAMRFKPNPYVSINCSGIYGVQIGSTNRKYAIGNAYEVLGCPITATVYYNTGSAVTECGGFLYIYDDQIRIRLVKQGGAGSFVTLNNVNQIEVTQINFTFATTDC